MAVYRYKGYSENFAIIVQYFLAGHSITFTFLNIAFTAKGEIGFLSFTIHFNQYHDLTLLFNDFSPKQVRNPHIISFGAAMPFTKTQFLEVFKDYNLTVFPMQIIFNMIAVICIIVLFRSFSGKNKIINGFLSILWLWIGIVYHFIFFSPINMAAYFFSILFIAQSAIFFYFGVLKERITYEKRKDFWGRAGWVLILYAIIIYPILGMIAGHGYPYQPTFGLPCPTTIFTFGILLFSTSRLKWYLIILPFIWSLIGFTAAFKLGIYEDIGLLISGLTALKNFKN